MDATDEEGDAPHAGNYDAGHRGYEIRRWRPFFFPDSMRRLDVLPLVDATTTTGRSIVTNVPIPPYPIFHPISRITHHRRHRRSRHPSHIHKSGGAPEKADLSPDGCQAGRKYMSSYIERGCPGSSKKNNGGRKEEQLDSRSTYYYYSFHLPPSFRAPATTEELKNEDSCRCQNCSLCLHSDEREIIISVIIAAGISRHYNDRGVGWGEGPGEHAGR